MNILGYPKILIPQGVTKKIEKKIKKEIMENQPILAGRERRKTLINFSPSQNLCSGGWQFYEL